MSKPKEPFPVYRAKTASEEIAEYDATRRRDLSDSPQIPDLYSDRWASSSVPTWTDKIPPTIDTPSLWQRLKALWAKNTAS